MEIIVLIQIDALSAKAPPRKYIRARVNVIVWKLAASVRR